MKEKGQAALIILAVLAVAFTLGISLSRQILTDVAISEQEKESAKAFSAAEAGIEEAIRKLKTGGDISEIDAEGIAADIGVDRISIDYQVSGSSESFIYPQEIVKPGETVVIWLRDHNSDGTLNMGSGYQGDNIDVCWENRAALEVIYFYDSGGSYRIKRFAFDPDDSGRRNDNSFSDADDALAHCLDLDFGVNISFPAGTPLFLLVRPFYQGAKLGFRSEEIIPSQGFEIYSTGEVKTGAEEKASRRIRIFRSWSTPPPFFFDTVFSGTGVSGG